MKSVSGSLRKKQRAKRWCKYSEDVLPLWIADMDFEVADEITSALVKYTEERCYGYRHAPLEAAPIVVEHLDKTFNWKVSEEDIVWIPSARAALNIGAYILGSKDSDVLVPTPIYPPFLFAAASAYKNMVNVHNVNDSLDIVGIKQALSDNCSALLFCNPHNPVGRVYSKEELTELANTIVETDSFIVSDEVHALLLMDESKKHIPIATISEEIASRTITLMGPGKPYNIAGLACAFAVITNEELRERFNKEIERRIVEVTPSSFFGFMAAYTKADKWLEECLSYLRENAAFLHKEINSLPGYSMNKVEGSYLAWIKTENDTEEYHLGNKLGVIPAAAFGSKGHIRLNFACSRENLELAIERLL